MKDWSNSKELVDKVAQAWRDAYATGPRDSNEHLEASKFLAMLNAVVPLAEIFGSRDGDENPVPEQGPAETIQEPAVTALPSPEMVSELETQQQGIEGGTPQLPEVSYADHSG
jgi:hypothetical protein